MRARDAIIVVSAALALVLLGAVTPAMVAAHGGAPACDRIEIGLFAAASGARLAESRELRRGAEIAVRRCTDRGLRCALAAAKGTGQWSAGPGELVRMVYAGGIEAVLGAADGRTGHLAEQVVARAKGRFLFLTPWASDPTLTQIRIPWFFALAPDDRLQAAALLGVIGGNLRNVVALVTETDYDSRTAWKAVEKIAATRGAPPLREIHVPAGGEGIDEIAARVRAAGATAVLFLVPPEPAARAARRLRNAGVTAPYFGPLRLAAPPFLDTAGDAAEGMVFAAPPEPEDSTGDGFGAGYRRAYKRAPSAVAAYGYDGATVLIEATRSAACGGRESLREALAATRRRGATGMIAFDASGRRAGPAPLARLEQGHLRPLAPLSGSAGPSAAAAIHRERRMR